MNSKRVERVASSIEGSSEYLIDEGKRRFTRVEDSLVTFRDRLYEWIPCEKDATDMTEVVDYIIEQLSELREDVADIPASWLAKDAGRLRRICDEQYTIKEAQTIARRQNRDRGTWRSRRVAERVTSSGS